MHSETTQGRRVHPPLRHIRLLGLVLILITIATGVASRSPSYAATSQLVVHYANYNPTPLTATQVQPVFEVVNTGSSSVALSNLTIRYWFTIDTNQPLVFTCFYATVGCNNITVQIPLVRILVSTSRSTTATSLIVG